jgi:hypothetical protein
MNYMVYGEYTSQEGEKDEWSKWCTL